MTENAKSLVLKRNRFSECAIYWFQLKHKTCNRNLILIGAGSGTARICPNTKYLGLNCFCHCAALLKKSIALLFAFSFARKQYKAENEQIC